MSPAAILRRQRGAALITVLLMISLLSLIGIAALKSATLQTRIARAQQQMDEARSLADAGLQHARTYSDTGHANYTTETSLPITPSYSIDSQSPTLGVSASTNGIYTLTSSYALASGSSASLTGYERLPMGAAWLNGLTQIGDGASEINGTDVCGTHDLAGIATPLTSAAAILKTSGDYSQVTGSIATSPSVAYGLSSLDVAGLINTLEAAGIPDVTIVGGSNSYTTAHGDPSSDVSCNASNMQVVLSTGSLSLKASGCGLLLVEGDLSMTAAYWRGIVLITGGISTKDGAGITGALIGAGPTSGGAATNDIKTGDGGEIGYVRWCSTAARWANDLTRETGAQVWFSRWTDLPP